MDNFLKPKLNPFFYCDHCNKDVKDNCYEYFNPDSGKYSRKCKLCGNTIARLKIGRNDKCPCGSGKKYKNCHLNIIKNGITQQNTGK
jgi:hypothetical protein